ncbi:hypothetical protein HYX18_02385 [Candidatus Woesearchaeota archaeon]|nr:hypothetical protein [Candidatus Woesearchaeota archaeon]
MEKIRFIGLNEFDSAERSIINELTDKHIKKISRAIGDYELVIKVKKHSTANKKIDESVKYSIHAKMEFPNILIMASYADWDLRRTMHKTFEKLHNEIKHKFKTNKKSWVRKRYHNA